MSAEEEGSEGKTPTSQNLRQQGIRRRLLRASLEVAAHLGYGGLSVAAVIDSAEVSRGGFYAQFEGAEDCFGQAIEGCAESLARKVEEAVGVVGEERALEAVLGALFRFSAEDQPAARALFIESLGAGPRCLEVREALCERCAGLVEEARTVGPQLDIPAELVIGGVLRLLAMRLRRREAGLGELPVEVPEWVASYEIEAGAARWAEPLRGGSAEESAPAVAESEALPRGRHRLSRVEVATNQRERILAATARLVYEHGYRALTVSEITAAAKLSRKVFYSQFRDRQQAASEAHELLFQEGMAATAAGFFSSEEWPERVWGAGRALTSFVAAHPHNAYLSFVESHAIGEAAINQTYDRVAAFTLFLEEGYHYRPEAERLPRICSEAVAALMFEIVHREMREHRSVSRLAADPSMLVYLILAPFMGPEAAGDFVEAKARGGEAAVEGTGRGAAAGSGG